MICNLFVWELNHGQTLWDKKMSKLGTSEGIDWELGEHFENLMGTNPLKKYSKEIGTILDFFFLFSLCKYH
jgi:hypothetical protein